MLPIVNYKVSDGTQVNGFKIFIFSKRLTSLLDSMECKEVSIICAASYIFPPQAS